MAGENAAHALLHDILAPIRPILAREDVTDLCINGPGPLFVEGAYGWERIPADNLTATWLSGFAKAVASYMSASIGERSPILSGHLPTGERIQIVLPPAAEEPSVTIRRPSHVTFSLDELAEKGAFDLVAPDLDGKKAVGKKGAGQGGPVGHRASVRSRFAGWSAEDQASVPGLLREIVAHRLNVIISGATGSGKTTLSKAMMGQQPKLLRAIQRASQLLRQPTGLDQLEPEGRDETAMGLGRLGLDLVGERGARGIEHRVVGAIAGAVRVSGIEQQASRCQGPVGLLHQRCTVVRLGHKRRPSRAMFFSRRGLV